MNILLALLVGVLFTAGTYQLMRRSLVRVVIGVSLLAHGANLLLIAMSGLRRGRPPLIVDEPATYVDPLPQALILTAIVIGFGTQAFLLVLSYRADQEFGLDDTDELRREVR
jgi:multicomponent Na+:H+ antiporter subunit C